MSEFCSESLLELHLEHKSGFALDFIPIPTKESPYTFHGLYFIRSKKYPPLRQLILRRSLRSQRSVSGGDFLHLQRISIEKNLKSEVETLILKSPKLKTFRVVKCPYELHLFVNKNVPDLEDIELWGTSFYNNSYLNDVRYHFKN